MPISRKFSKRFDWIRKKKKSTRKRSKRIQSENERRITFLTHPFHGIWIFFKIRHQLFFTLYLKDMLGNCWDKHSNSLSFSYKFKNNSIDTLFNRWKSITTFRFRCSPVHFLPRSTPQTPRPSLRALTKTQKTTSNIFLERSMKSLTSLNTRTIDSWLFCSWWKPPRPRTRAWWSSWRLPENS